MLLLMWVCRTRGISGPLEISPLPCKKFLSQLVESVLLLVVLQERCGTFLSTTFVWNSIWREAKMPQNYKSWAADQQGREEPHNTALVVVGDSSAMTIIAPGLRLPAGNVTIPLSMANPRTWCMSCCLATNPATPSTEMSVPWPAQVASNSKQWNPSEIHQCFWSAADLKKAASFQSPSEQTACETGRAKGTMLSYNVPIPFYPSVYLFEWRDTDSRFGRNGGVSL